VQSSENVEDSKPDAITAFNYSIDNSDNKFFAELMKLQDFYCDWRKKISNKPVVDDSTSFVNESGCF